MHPMLAKIEHEWQSGPVSRLLIAVWRKLRNMGRNPRTQLAQAEHLA